MKKQIGSLILISILISGCGSQFAMLSSTAGLAASHNSYVKAYNGLDLITTFTTEKDIKTHLYETAKATVKTAKATFEAGQSEFKIYNKKYYSGNLTGENAPITDVKEEVLVASITTEPKVEKVEKVEKQQTMAWKLCYLSFFLALAMGAFVLVSAHGVISLSKTKKTRKVKKKRKTKKKGRR